MRYIQNLLFVIGTTALSTIAGAFVIGAVVALLQRPGGEPWTRGFGQYIGALVCGLPLGALVGLVGSVSFVFSRGEHEVWSVFVWLGIALGVLAGTALAFHWDLTTGNQWWLPVTLVAIASGAAGGFLAGAAVAICRAAGKRVG
ncbi:MAG: hypothetical protein ACT4QC_05240 [Planctomycetaceae bacterium]